MYHQDKLREECINEHANLVMEIAGRPRKRITTELIERVITLVRYVQSQGCFFFTERSVFTEVKRMARNPFGYVPEYTRRQKELLEALDHCCLYVVPYRPF